jgi:hypothetical protein
MLTGMATAWFGAVPALAECLVPGFDGSAPTFELSIPALPDPNLRPERPACLGDPADPSGENCPRDVILTYGTAVDAYLDALRAYVDESSGFANEAVDFANRAVDHAHSARGFSDAAFDWANCEVDAISDDAE